MKKKIYLGIIFFGVTIILSSIGQMLSLYGLGSNFDRYKHYMQDWPRNLIIARYCFSWAQRIVGLTAGVGLLFKKELSRKIIIILGCFTLCVLYWKHPYAVFENIADNIFHNFPVLTQYNIDPSAITISCLILVNLCEFLFWGILIYYFTRQKVKSQFR